MADFAERAKGKLWFGLIGLTALPALVRLPSQPVCLAMALLVVALGALHAITLREGARECGESGEVISLSAAMQFPLYAGGALLCLYLVFQNVEGELLVRLFRAQFVLVAHSVLAAFVAQQLQPRLAARKLPYGVGAHIAAGHALSGVVCLAYLFTAHWTLNNALGAALAVVSIAGMRVSRAHVLLLLHSLLFFYDVFFVFGTDVMVGVAQWLDVPIKLKLPSKARFAALGLGIFYGDFLSVGTVH